MSFALLLTACAVAGAAAGVKLGTTNGLPPRIAAIGGGLLFGISLFWVLPDIIDHAGWRIGAAALCAGVVLLWCFDRFVHPICPECSHAHDHGHCNEPPLHGFAVPVLLASGIHSFIDGWSVRLLGSTAIAGWAAPFGLALHKVPEGMAIGLVARESMKSGRRAFLSCVVVECMTLVGAFVEPAADQAGAAHFGAVWMTCVLAIAGGSFLYLGFHTVHGSRNKPGVIPTFLLTLGAVGGIAFAHRRYGAI